MVFGTFDGLHKGHLDFFRQAKALDPNPFLIVSVARDENVKKIKGKDPNLTEKERKLLISKSGLADKVVLGGVKEYIPHIVSEKPDIIALGYDQIEYVSNLREDLKKKNINPKIVRLRPYKEHIYKNRLLKAKRLG